MKKKFDKELFEKIGAEAYYVTQENQTEAPFYNKYYKFNKEGIYVDVVSKEPLFASVHKYNSASGWPSFYQALEKENLVEKEDLSLNMRRVELRSKSSDSHLGHVFKDGPAPSGLRYCINSAALKFIALEDLKEQGYEKYLYLFKK